MDLAFLSATDLARTLVRGEFTSEALVTELLARIRTYDPMLNAFVEVYGDAALLAARESDGCKGCIRMCSVERPMTQVWPTGLRC